MPPIRARKLTYYTDRNFLARRLPAPGLAEGRYLDVPTARGDDWSGQIRGTDERLDKPWSELVTSTPADDESRPLAPVIPRRKKDKAEHRLSDLPLFAAIQAEPEADAAPSDAGEDLDKVIQFPGLRL